VTLSDGKGALELRLRCDGRCMIDRLRVRGRDVLAETGVWTGILLDGQWITTRTGLVQPQVEATPNTVLISGIRYGGGEVPVSESWAFRTEADRIVWRIDRNYESGGGLADTAFPSFDFHDLATWTGGLLGSGGVAWVKLFDRPNATYGVHNGKVTFWDEAKRACLRIEAASSTRSAIAVRYTRQPSGAFSCAYSASEEARAPRRGLSRFLRDRQDVWRPLAFQPGRVSIELTLSAPEYEVICGRGVFKRVDGDAIGEICRTISRIGAVDEEIMGSNGFYSDCAVLHEPWIAQLGLAIDDPDYTRAFSDTLDFQRRHAIGPDGRVKSRWAGTSGDAMVGTYDALGYYECQWGWLMDSQTSWVINVAEQFDLNADRSWLERQKSACEQALEYLLRRDSDDNGLMEMMAGSRRDGKGSDWIDVVWAAHENALVNAQLFWALTRWADCEELLGDSVHASRYQTAAAKLKRAFNRRTTDGGFWDEQRQCYVYWRDKDGSVHGTNLVVPVNFSTIGYGLCDDPGRRVAILGQMEQRMQAEHLFAWPLCFESYARDEVHPRVNWPFPSYENGDLFLAWAELGTRAYAAYDPAIALRYVQRVLAQYAKDGLAFQRYLRRSQAGAGDDILANNGSIIVGLYRNLYGIQPKHNRLYLEPHLVLELNGTELRYGLRGEEYTISLSVGHYAIAARGCVVRDERPFGVNIGESGLEYFPGTSATAALAVHVPEGATLELEAGEWSEVPSDRRTWSETCRKAPTVAEHVISGLRPNASYALYRNGQRMNGSVRSDAAGRARFTVEWLEAGREMLEVGP
jgi:hypothetical protein